MADVQEHSGIYSIRIVKRALQYLCNRGLAFTLRQAIWRLHYELYQRLRGREVRSEQASPVISFHNHEFELHPSIVGVSEELLLYGVHEPLATSTYLRQLSPGDHVIDIGSNLGYYVLLASQRVGPMGRVLGFEPAPSVYSILQRNVQRSGQSNIQVFPWAITSKTDSVEFSESDTPNWGSLFHDDRLQHHHAITVTGKRLDDVVCEFPGFHPSVLRMDVEGAELIIFDGGQEVLHKYRPGLFIELHNVVIEWRAARDLLTNLLDLGYSTGVLIQRTWDQPWMSSWMRRKRCWSGQIDELIRRIESPDDPLMYTTISVILPRPGMVSGRG